MKATNRSRILAPAIVVVGGSIIACAVGVGHGWGHALLAEIITLLLGTAYYLMTGSNSDIGAIYRRRADERQRLVFLKASVTALRVTLAAAFVCVVITVALKQNYWQADLIGSLGGVSFLLGLAAYGASEDDVTNQDVEGDESTDRRDHTTKGVME
jgi:Predicted membrane protein (DUF2178)